MWKITHTHKRLNEHNTQNNNKQTGPALMFDSLYALARGVHALHKSTPRSILTNTSASCDSESAWNEGSSLYNYINAVSLSFSLSSFVDFFLFSSV